ncbi:MAG: hypothetical protein CR974_01820 [Gammaproteobacteria bacterium]|nr:MAG: hypothetical protein CR974_01820 [Gammaproteobacteria bacterium]
MTNLTCRDLMLQDQVTLHPEDTVSKAFRLMRSKGMRFLPVVDDHGQYVGVFTSPTLIRLLLPPAVTIDVGGKNLHKGLNDLKFFNMSKEKFSEALDGVKGDAVKNYLSDPDNIPVTHPDTPIMEGILLLHKHKRHVILVEPDTRQFVGVLSINSSLRNIFDEETDI